MTAAELKRGQRVRLEIRAYASRRVVHHDGVVEHVCSSGDEVMVKFDRAEGEYRIKIAFLTIQEEAS